MDFSGNNRKVLYIVIGVVVACIVCVGVAGMIWLVATQVLPKTQGTPAQPVQQVTEAVSNSPVESMVFAKDITQDFVPVNETSVFGPQDTIHAIANIKRNAPDGNTYRIEWYVGDIGDPNNNGKIIDKYEMQANAGQVLDFTLKPNQGWPTGTYRADLFVNGQLDRSLTFSVQ